MAGDRSDGLPGKALNAATHYKCQLSTVAGPAMTGQNEVSGAIPR